jgi:hypothetical protein
MGKTLTNNITCTSVATGVILQRSFELYLLNENLVTLVAPNNNRMPKNRIKILPRIYTIVNTTLPNALSWPELGVFP